MVRNNPSFVTITLGSNRFIGTSGLISVKGKELFKIDTSGTKPLITVEIRDRDGTLLGKLWKSTSFVYWHENYEPEYEREKGEVNKISLKGKSDGKTIFELVFKSPNDIEINGIFYVQGIPFPIIATPQYLDLNTNKFRGMTIVKSGKGIEISEDFIAI